MPDPQIEKLLIVQSRDIHLLKIEQDLQRIPNELSSLMTKISIEEANIEDGGQGAFYIFLKKFKE